MSKTENSIKAKELEAKARKEYELLSYEVIGPSGLPDLICIKNNEIVFVECKAGCSPVRTRQRKAHNLLRQHGFTVEVYRDNSKQRCGFIEQRRSKQALYGKFLCFKPNSAIPTNL